MNTHIKYVEFTVKQISRVSAKASTPFRIGSHGVRVSSSSVDGHVEHGDVRGEPRSRTPLPPHRPAPSLPRKRRTQPHIQHDSPDPRRRWVLGRTKAPGSINPPAAPPSAPRSETPAWSGLGGSPAPARTETGHCRSPASGRIARRSAPAPRGSGAGRGSRPTRRSHPRARGRITITGRTSGSSAWDPGGKARRPAREEAPIGRSPRRRHHHRHQPRGAPRDPTRCVIRPERRRRPRPRPASRPARVATATWTRPRTRHRATRSPRLYRRGGSTRTRAWATIESDRTGTRRR